MSTRRSHIILMLLIAAALAGVGSLAIPGSPLYQKPVLGLDLQGGLEVVLKAVPPPGRPLQQSDLKRSVTIIRERIDKLGVSEPDVREQGEDQISVQLAGVFDQDRAKEIIGKTAQLELFDLETSLVGPSIDANGRPVPNERLHDLLTRVQSQAAGTHYLFGPNERVAAGPFPTRQALLNSKVDLPGDNVSAKVELQGKVPKGYKVLTAPKNTVVITCGPDAVVCPGDAPGEGLWFYLFKYEPNAENPIPQMTGKDLRLSGTRADLDPETRGPQVLMQFTDDGGDKFQEITRDEWLRGSLRRAPQHFAIVLDRNIKSFPQIDYTDGSLAGGIGGGSARITGIVDMGEARDIALVLQTGALPVKFTTLESTEISATLGEDSLREALRAAIVGMLVVALFLLLVYRFLGLVAVMGLAIYAAFLYGAILLFDVTLTLPGFAGMILTIGVAADANIVVFERIKEESRAGKSVRAAISTGYAKGFATIIDANVVTAITALVLFAVASAGVKGFALMLLIGTAMSVVTAVFATRAMLGLLAGFRWFDSPRFMGAEGQQVSRWIQHDYVGKRNVWFAISAVVLGIAIGSLAIQQLNLGIDFRGGTELSFRTPQPVDISKVREQAGRFEQAGAVIQGKGTEFGNEQYRRFEIRTEELDEREQNQLERALEEEVGATAMGVNTVSGSFGQEIARGAIYAIVISLLLVTLYITIRFQWKFALATMVALLHDVLIAIGIYSLLDREVTTATVAAVLTVLGYSIYDSIIILDRVRENMPLMRTSSFRTIGNVSLWETIRRSLATTFITLLPIGALYFFGGDTLKDFAFALLVGIGSGAYSSIFIAVPLVSVLKEREPEWARRREQVDEGPEPDGGSPARKRPWSPRPSPAGVGGALALEEATQAAAAEPAPTIGGGELVPEGSAAAQARRERRRQRRRTRPHGRAR